MRRLRSAGFTLIEMLLVISIIALLMAVLIPQIGAVMQAIKIKDTHHRIGMIHQVVEDYKRVYWAYPPSTSPNLNMKPLDATGYPPYHYPSGEPATYLFCHGGSGSQPFGGKFLVYFLMGPDGAGWHRPRNPGNTADPQYRNRGIRAEWDCPDGLSAYLKNAPLDGGDHGAYPAPCFIDGFGVRGGRAGLIGYAAASGRGSGVARWTKGNNLPFYLAYYWDCRKVSGSWGDGRGTDHMNRMLEQCPGDFVLLSPGPNGKYGWRVYGMGYAGETRKSWYADFEHGVTDDIGNFPLR